MTFHKHDTLQYQAYQFLLDLISSGKLSTGSVTSEAQLCGMMDMSRTPVRSALQRLEWEGFLQIVPKHGILILEASAERIGSLIELIGSLVLYTTTASPGFHSAELAAAGAALQKEIKLFISHNLPLTSISDYDATLLFNHQTQSSTTAVVSYTASVPTSTPAADPAVLVYLEQAYLHAVVQQHDNTEMQSLLEQTMAKLQWTKNDRRWRSLHAQHTAQLLYRFIEATQLTSVDHPYATIQPYIAHLKLTWS